MRDEMLPRLFAALQDPALSWVPKNTRELRRFVTKDLPAFYDHLTLHIVPGPRSPLYFLPFVLLFATLLTPPSCLALRTIRFAILPAICALQVYIWERDQSFDVISFDGLLTIFMFLGWYDVRERFQHVSWRAPDRTKAELEAYPVRIGWAKLRWIGTLFISLQLKDFLIGERSHDQKQLRPPIRRRFSTFFLRTLLHAVFSYLLLDTTSWLIRSEAHPALRGILIPPRVGAPPLAWHATFLQSITLLAHLYAALSLYTAYLPMLLLLALIWPFPALHHHPFVSPLVLNPHFGAIGSIWSPTPARPAWGLRAFWGIFWHQNLRYLTSAPGLALAHVLGLRERSTARYGVIATVAFVLSGIVHMGMVPPEPLHTSMSAAELRLRIAGFFWLQAAGVGIEVLLDRRRARKARGQGPVTKQAGSAQTVPPYSAVARLGMAAWTLAFLAVAAYFTALPVGRELEWWRMPAVPVSLVAYLAGEKQWWQTLGL